MAGAIGIVTTLLMRERYQIERGRFLLRVLVVTTMLLVTSLAAALSLASRSAEVRYLQLDHAGSFTNYTPLDQANAADDEIIAWAKDAVLTAYRVDFVNFRSQLQMSELNMTHAGWIAFRDALIESANIRAIQAQKLTASPKLTGEPVLLKKGPFNGRFAWKIEMPLSVRYASSRATMTQDINVTVVVVRHPEYLNPSGLAIAQIIGR